MRGHILVVGKSTDNTTCKPHLINFVNFTMCIILEKGCYLSVCLHKMYTCTVCKSAAWLVYILKSPLLVSFVFYKLLITSMQVFV